MRQRWEGFPNESNLLQLEQNWFPRNSSQNELWGSKEVSQKTCAKKKGSAMKNLEGVDRYTDINVAREPTFVPEGPVTNVQYLEEDTHKLMMEFINLNLKYLK